MKGVVLAGGLGTRFRPITNVVNKHLLDVFDEPMIFFPIRSLAKAGIRQIVVVTGDDIGQFERLLGDGSDLGVKLTYAHQAGELGIADALAKAKPSVEGERVVVILGDNIFQDDLAPFLDAYRSQEGGARVILKRVSREDAKRFGVARLEGERLVSIVEKPVDPPSGLVVTGCYMYDERVFDVIEGLTVSARGEYEITDVNNFYASSGELAYDILPGWWTDAGTPASKLKASILVALAKGVTFHA